MTSKVDLIERMNAKRGLVKFQLDKLLVEMADLGEGPHSARDLVGKFQVSYPTLRRWLEKLRDAYEDYKILSIYNIDFTDDKKWLRVSVKRKKEEKR